jgi:1,2-diacylglycerol 3-alpha-glucosyltransferase
MKMRVGLFNESFAPTVDGVAKVTENYAYWIGQKHGESTVITPNVPGAVDDYPFEVKRYASFTVPLRSEYRFGHPKWDAPFWRELKKTEFDIVHAHSPFGSGGAARAIANRLDVPFVTTFHSKFKEDFKVALKVDAIVNIILAKIAAFYESADEVWVVNESAVDTLREYGYRGDVHIMENGCDIGMRYCSCEATEQIDKMFSMEADTPLFMYIGQHTWQKNLKMVMESLKILRDSGTKFHMVFIGDGAKRKEMERMSADFGLERNVTFAGKIYDREIVSKIYLRSSAMLFPSTYDTSSLVPKEAAACGCPTVFVKGSSTAQGITDDNGFLIENNAQSLAQVTQFIAKNMDVAKKVGEHARKSVYRSWEDAVDVAVKRYEYLIEQKKSKSAKV